MAVTGSCPGLVMLPHPSAAGLRNTVENNGEEYDPKAGKQTRLTSSL